MKINHFCKYFLSSGGSDSLTYQLHESDTFLVYKLEYQGASPESIGIRDISAADTCALDSIYAFKFYA